MFHVNPPKSLEDYRVPKEGGGWIRFFKTNPASEWRFENYTTSPTDPAKLNDYKYKLLLLLRSSHLPKELRPYVGELRLLLFFVFYRNAAKSKHQLREHQVYRLKPREGEVTKRYSFTFEVKNLLTPPARKQLYAKSFMSPQKESE